MNKKLLLNLILKLLSGFICIGLLLFISAGTFAYWNAWLFIILLFVPMIIVGTVLLIKKPSLLEKRLKSKEVEPEQKRIIIYSALIFVCGFIMAGLDFRFKITNLPRFFIIIASIIFILAYAMYVEVIRENEFLSRTVEIQENQKVIDTGLYGIVRHPMYLASLLLFISMPLVLGSLGSFVIFLTYPIVISRRIKNEEKVLEENLTGYKEYESKVKYRIIPFIW